MASSRLAAVLLAALAPLAWSSNVIASRVLVVRGVDPLVLTAVRWLLAAAMLAAYARATGRRLAATRSALAVGLLGITLFNNLLYFALRYSPAALVGIVFGLTPVATMLIARLAGYERLDAGLLAAAVLGFMGVALLEASSLKPGAGLLWLGLLLAVAAVLAWALYTVASKRLMRGMDPLEALASSTVASTPFNLAVAAPRLTPPQLGLLLGDALNLSLLLYIAAVPGFLAYLAWFKAVKALGAGPTSVFINLLPVSTLILAVILLGEKLTLLQAVGAALVFASLALATYRQLRLAYQAPRLGPTR